MNDNYPRNDIHADIITFIHIIVLTQLMALAAAVVVWSCGVLMFGASLGFWGLLKICAIIALVVSVLALGQIKVQGK